MTSEQELRDNRRRRGAQLREFGAMPFPAVSFFATEQAARDKLLDSAKQAELVAALPHEADLDEAAISDGSSHVPLFGRLVAKRGPFLVIRTARGDAQALVRADCLTETDAKALKLVDLADHVEVRGIPIQTRTGALALRAVSFRILGKAHLPPPAKWHGLKDIEKRYRERYVDLFANPDVAEIFRARSTMSNALRSYLVQQGFLEVETPLLHPVRGGATAKPFATHHNALDLPLYLRIAPELYLKRLIVGGLERVFEIGRTFRNEGISTRHNPEFTLLEFYMAYGSYEDLMNLGEQLIRAADQTLQETFPKLCGDRKFSLDEPWLRITMRDALVARGDAERQGSLEASRWAPVLNRDDVYNEAKLLSVAQEISSTKNQVDHAKKPSSYGELVYEIFEEVVEPVLTKLFRTADGAHSLPVFICEYPAEVSPLARRNDLDPRWVDRFELFVEGRELANAFNELNDPDDQADRFRAQLTKQSAGDEEAMDFDTDYIRALSHGMPPTAGFGLGVDRLAMMLLGQDSIRDVLAFPLLRPDTSDDGAETERDKATQRDAGRKSGATPS